MVSDSDPFGVTTRSQLCNAARARLQSSSMSNDLSTIFNSLEARQIKHVLAKISCQDHHRKACIDLGCVGGWEIGVVVRVEETWPPFTRSSKRRSGGRPHTPGWPGGPFVDPPPTAQYSVGAAKANIVYATLPVFANEVNDGSLFSSGRAYEPPGPHPPPRGREKSNLQPRWGQEGDI